MKSTQLNLSVVKLAPKAVRTQSDIDKLSALLGHPVLLPANYKTKEVVVGNWPSIEYTDTRAPQFREAILMSNVAILMGSPSRDLIGLDCDSESRVSEMETRNPLLAETFTTQGQPGRKTFWLRMKGEYPGVRKEIKDLEWRGGGCYCLVDGIHPVTGKPYKVVNAVAPRITNFSELWFPPELAQKLRVLGSSANPLPSPDSYPIESPIELPTETPTAFSIGTTVRGTENMVDDEDAKMYLVDIPGERITKERLLYRPIAWTLFQSIRMRRKAQPGKRNDSMIVFATTSVTAMGFKLAYQMESLWFRLTDMEIGWNMDQDTHMASFTKHYNTALQSYPTAIEIQPPFSSRELGAYRSLRDENEKTAFRIFRNSALQMKKYAAEYGAGNFPMPRRQLACRLMITEDDAKKILATFQEMGILGLRSKGTKWRNGTKPQASIWQYLLVNPEGESIAA
jgi:hypothetical protein